MKILFDKTGQTEEQWQEYRQNQKGIGGSDVAVILGLSPFRTSFNLWLEKTGQIEKKKIKNEYVEWGNLLEPIIRDYFRRLTGFEVEEYPYVIQHETHEFMVANVDGLVIDPAYNGKKGVLEIKTTDARNRKDWETGIPDYYMCQVQHYLAVLEMDYAYIAVLIGGNHFRYFKIERDDYIIDQIIAAEMQFMEMVEKQIAPEIVPQDSDSIAELYPEDDGETALLPPDLEDLAYRYWDIQKELKSLETELDTVKNKIKYFAGENKYLRGVRLKVSLPTITKKILDTKRLAAEQSELYEYYKTKESSYRGFTVKMVDE